MILSEPNFNFLYETKSIKEKAASNILRRAHMHLKNRNKSVSNSDMLAIDILLGCRIKILEEEDKALYGDSIRTSTAN